MFGLVNRDDFIRRGSFKRSHISCRADAVVAPAAETAIGTTINSKNLNQHAAFCAFAANKSTCSIRITSARQKSRATIILFRGRVLSCVYGKRGIDNYFFGLEAFNHAQVDLFNHQAEFTVHALDEETALASAAFFEGEKQDQPEHSKIQDFFSRTSQKINAQNAPGCFVVRDNEKNTYCIVYFYGGKIIGIFSYEKGWMKDNRFETALKAVTTSKGDKTSVYILPAQSLEEIYDTTFSLTGVADNEWERYEWLKTRGDKEKSIPQLNNRRPSGLKDTFEYDSNNQYQAALAQLNSYAIRQVRRHGHSISPGAERDH
ncbi:MAG TPA: hypothetical protein V6C76_11960 [Drouetiella sp.]